MKLLEQMLQGYWNAINKLDDDLKLKGIINNEIIKHFVLISVIGSREEEFRIANV